VGKTDYTTKEPSDLDFWKEIRKGFQAIDPDKFTNDWFVTIPFWLFSLLGTDKAIILSYFLRLQFMKKPDEPFWKSYREIERETGLSKHRARNAISSLSFMGIVEHAGSEMANGGPTNRYKIKKEHIYEALVKNLPTFGKNLPTFGKNLPTFGKNLPNHNRIDSEDTHKISEDTFNGSFPSAGSPAGNPAKVTFEKFLEEDLQQWEDIHREEVEAIRHFLTLYQNYRGKSHPEQTPEQWESHIYQIFEVQWNGAYAEFGDFDDYDDLISAIELYFREGQRLYRNSPKRVDYHLSHFNSGEIKLNLRRELERLYEAVL